MACQIDAPRGVGGRGIDAPEQTRRAVRKVCMQLAVPLSPQFHPLNDLPTLLNYPGHLPQRRAAALCLRLSSKDIALH